MAGWQQAGGDKRGHTAAGQSNFQQQLVCRVGHNMMVAKSALHYGNLAVAPAQALHQREAKGLAHRRHDRHLAGNEHGPAYGGEKVGMGVRGSRARIGDAPATPEGKGTAVQNIEQSINTTTLTKQVAHMASTMVLILAKKSGTEISMPTADRQEGAATLALRVSIPGPLNEASALNLLPMQRCTHQS